jgi:hypothetical protein
MTPEHKSKFNFIYANAGLGLTDVRYKKRPAPDGNVVAQGGHGLDQVAGDHIEVDDYND